MKRCPYCAEEIQDEAIVCRFCGRDLAPPPLPAPPPPLPTGRQPITAAQRSNRGMMVLVAFLLLMGLGLSVALSEHGVKPAPDRSDAWYMCRQFVEKRLASPASAKFPVFDKENVFDLKGGQFRAISYVDSQNRFGAMMRTTFTCTVTPLGNKKWRLDSLTLDE